MSRKFLNDCLYSVYVAFRDSNASFSHQTKYDYRESIRGMVKELHASGYQLSNIQHMKRKHVDFLLNEWKARNVGVGTIKNRLSHLRYLSGLIGRPGMLPKENTDLGVGQRSYVSAESKAIHEIDLSKFENPLIRYSVQLQQHFGLRREEAMKFIVSEADLETQVRLKPSWTKGGFGRDIPITNLEQRALLDELKKVIAPGKSLIPDDKNYADQKIVYKAAVRQAGYSNLHGLRHAYAQRRYHEILNKLTGGSGWPAPFNGGKKRKDMTPIERVADFDARGLVSRELGHSRRQIVATYIGR